MFCLAGFGNFVYWFIYHLIVGIRLYREKGYFWSKKDSYYFKSDLSLDWEVVRLIGARSIIGILTCVTMMMIFKTSVDSGASSPIILSLLSGAALTTGLAFFIVFHEKITKKHLIAMIFLIASVIFIANS